MTNKAIALALVAPAALALAASRHEAPKPLAAPGAPAVTAEALPVQAGAVRYVVAASGNEARYRVQEKLVGVDIPNYEAIGKTPAVTGAIVLDQAGRVVPAQSRITIDVTELASDQERRDGFVQRRLLETEKHPTVVFAPTAIRGLTGPLPTTGSKTFQLVGNLTVKGVTKPTTWNVTAQFQGGRITGTAVSDLTFSEFSLEKPSVPVVLSLADQFKLEYSFSLAQQAAS